MPYINSRGEVVDSRSIMDWRNPMSTVWAVIDFITQFFTTMLPIENTSSSNTGTTGFRESSGTGYGSGGSRGSGRDSRGDGPNGNIRGMRHIRPPPPPPGGCAFGSCGM